MVYGSYARGYKGMGYNMGPVTGVTPDASLFFEAETVDSYEAGRSRRPCSTAPCC